MNITLPIVLYRVFTIFLCLNNHVHIYDTHRYNNLTVLTEQSIFQEPHTVLHHFPILRWTIGAGHTFTLNTRYRSVFINIHSANTSSARSQTLLQLALLSGDIHPHPGPAKHPCTICDRPVAKNHHALQCDSCHEWVHVHCDGITKEEYRKFQNLPSLVFECPKCNLLTFTDSFFISDETNLNLHNSFQNLSDSLTPEDCLEHQPSPSPTSQRNPRKNKRGLRIMNVNCRSLISDAKQLALQDLIETHDPDIILGCESHLDPQIASSEVFPKEFCNPYRKDRALSEGGVFIAVKNNLITSEINTSTDCELAWASLNIQGSRQLIIGSFYRSPSSHLDKLEHLDRSIHHIISSSGNSTPHIILGGDFNLPSIDWERNKIASAPQYGKMMNNRMLDIASEHNLEQVVKAPTRENNTLDLVFTTNPNLIDNVVVHPGMSDHQIVLTDINLNAKTCKKRPRTVYIYRKADMNGVRTDLNDALSNRLKNIKPEYTVEDNWNFLKDTIKQAADRHIPQKTISGKQNVPWITQTIKRLIRQRQRRYNAAKQYNTSENWNKYREARNMVRRKLTEAHDDYIRGILNTDTEHEKPSMGKRFWQYIKSRKKDNVQINTLKDKTGRDVIDSRGKAELLNQQYNSVFTDEDYSTMPVLGASNTPYITPLHITEKGVCLLLKKLDASKAIGPDLLPTRVLKEAADQIAPFLTYIFNQSLNTGEVPTDWKLANITAIYKKGDKTQAVNYRPVSLTSISCKIMEHIVYHHIMAHLEKHSILADHQHGFRKNRSCETQLVNTIESVAKSLDQQEQVDMLVLDFSKAFDTVPHQRLLLKMNHYGIRGRVLGWISAWLTDRNQRVCLDGDMSEMTAVRSGVPQGTVLGPLCFLLYINDIGDSTSSELRLFADDSLLYRTIRDPESCTQLQNDLTLLVEWSKRWQMTFHPAKCYILRVTRKRKPVIHHYNMMGHVLETVHHYPYLGVEISDKLKWDHHISKTTSKANKTLGFLRRNLNKCPQDIKDKAYRSLVRPHLEYASAVWDPYRQCHIHQIEMIQHKAARFVTNTYSREPGTVTNILQSLGWPTLQTRRKGARLILLYKILHGEAAVNIPEYVKRPSVPTRHYHNDRFLRLSTSTDAYKFSFIPRTITDWNQLPEATIQAPSTEFFRERMWGYLM